MFHPLNEVLKVHAQHLEGHHQMAAELETVLQADDMLRAERVILVELLEDGNFLRAVDIAFFEDF